MKQKLLALRPYSLGLIAGFYVLPLFIRDTGTAMLLMLLAIPLLTFLCGVTYGRRRGFSLLFPLMTALLFAPTVFIFYNASAWVYIPAYAVIALAGTAIGKGLQKTK